MSTTKKSATTRVKKPKPVVRTNSDLALTAAKTLSQFRARNKPVSITLNGTMNVVVPGAVVAAIERACRAESDDELTSQEAADFLNVSRPYLIRLLDEGKLPFRLVGLHRRIQRRDVIEFDRRESSRRRAILRQLSADGQELGFGYDASELES
jgi:excisionase family DNA binding protein